MAAPSIPLKTLFCAVSQLRPSYFLSLPPHTHTWNLTRTSPFEQFHSRVYSLLLPVFWTIIASRYLKGTVNLHCNQILAFLLLFFLIQLLNFVSNTGRLCFVRNFRGLSKQLPPETFLLQMHFCGPSALPFMRYSTRSPTFTTFTLESGAGWKGPSLPLKRNWKKPLLHFIRPFSCVYPYGVWVCRCLCVY